MDSKTQKLSQLIIQETKLATKLLELMHEEKDALEENIPDKLASITQTKARCLDEMENTSRLRAQLLLALSTAPTSVERMNEYISKQPGQIKNSLNTQVNQLETILEQCRFQNSVNGMVINISQRNVQRNLNILKGIDHESMTYTQKGQTTNIGIKGGGLKA